MMFKGNGLFIEPLLSIFKAAKILVQMQTPSISIYNPKMAVSMNEAQEQTTKQLKGSDFSERIEILRAEEKRLMEQSIQIIDSIKFHKLVRETFSQRTSSFATAQAEDANDEIKKWQETLNVVKAKLKTVSKKIRAKLGFSETGRTGNDSIRKEEKSTSDEQ